jgi:glycine/D-amino acid oxidase-like deaminating enzyme
MGRGGSYSGAHPSKRDLLAPGVVVNRLKPAFPNVREPRLEFRRAGYVTFTTDHVPRLNELAPNLVGGLGYNGRDVAVSPMMGKLVAERSRAEDIPLPLPGTQIAPIAWHGWRATGIALTVGWKRLQDRINP